MSEEIKYLGAVTEIPNIRFQFGILKFFISTYDWHIMYMYFVPK